MRDAVIGRNGVLLVGLIGLLAGCNPQDAHNIQEDTKNLAQHTGEALSTVTLTAKVKTHLSLHKGVDQSGVSIDASKEGTVTISGQVRNKAEHDRIMSIVKETPGVEHLKDELKVEPPKGK